MARARSASAPFWRHARTAWPAAAAASVVTIGAAWLAWPLIATGFDRALLDAAEFRPLLMGRYGVYQAALLGLIVGCMMAYAALWRVSAAETFARSQPLWRVRRSRCSRSTSNTTRRT